MSNHTTTPMLAGFALAAALNAHHATTEPNEQDTHTCAYCNQPATTTRTGRQGNTFGLCDPCHREHLQLLGARAHQPATLTEPQTTLVHDNTLGAYRTAPIESTMRDLDDNATAAENNALPLLAAEIVVNTWRTLPPVRGEDGRWQSGGTLDGRFTQLWVSYGCTTGTVTPGKAREIAREMRQFAARLDALCDRADEIAHDDFEADA